MGCNMEDDLSEIEEVLESVEDAIQKKYDEPLIRYVATLLVRGKSEDEIRRTLNENSLIPSRAAPHEWKSLIRQSLLLADDIRSMVISKAEMEDIEHQRIDSYARRKRAIGRLEALIESSHSMADSVGKLNQVSFMVGGLIKAQESLDKFTGAQEAVPQVVVNVGYDPLQQFREVIQQEVIDSEFEIVESAEDDDDDIESNTD